MVVVVVGVEGRVGWGVEAISGDSLEIFFFETYRTFLNAFSSVARTFMAIWYVVVEVS